MNFELSVKNSYKNEPWIIVPKKRVTHCQYEELKNHQSPSDLLLKWGKMLKMKLEADLSPSAKYWTISDQLYEVSITKNK